MRRHSLKSVIGSMFAFLVVVGGVGGGLTDHGWLHRFGVAWFGPPRVAMAERYDEMATSDASFDHSLLDSVLRKHVDADGWVDYRALRRDASELDAYIKSLASGPFQELGRDDKLAMLINAYNAFTLRLILDYYPVESIRDIPEAKRWDDVRWNLAGERYSLNQIEHELIRQNFKEPRIHFALVCAAYSCPKLRNEVYTGDQLEDQLQDQTAYTHAHARWFRWKRSSDTVHLTALYDWYKGDFLSTSDSVLDYVADYVPALRAELDRGEDFAVRWLDYNWQLNDVTNAP